MRDFNNGFSKNIGLPALAKNSVVQRNFIWFSILAILLIVIINVPIALLSWSVVEQYHLSLLLETTIFILALPNLLLILMVILLVKYREKRSIDSIGLSTHSCLPHYIIGFIQGLGLIAILATVIYLLGGYVLHTESESDELGLVLGSHSIPNIIFILLGWFIQGASEEILTRGWMLPLLAYRYNVPFAIAVTTIFFVGLHLLNGGIDILPIINLFLYSIFASVYVLKYKNLWGICGLHTAWNWSQGNILGILVSGNTIPGGSIVVLHPQNSYLLSGGDFGIEGSYITSIVLLILCCYLTYSLIKTSATSASNVNTPK